MLLIRIDEGVERALTSGDEGFEKRYKARLVGNGALVRDVVSQTLSLLTRAPRPAELGCYLAVDEATDSVVGTCGFKAGPDANGSVEIAYFTFPRFEGRGYATSMARRLVALGGGMMGVREIVANTLPCRNASTRVLEKVGMRLIGEVDDPEDGRVWRWTLGRH